MSAPLAWRHAPAAEAYAWRELARRAGAEEATGGTGLEALALRVHYAKEGGEQPPDVSVIPARDGAWAGLAQLPPDSLQWLPLERVLPPGWRPPFDGPLPVLLWGEGHEGGTDPFVVQRPDGSLLFHADIVGSTLFLLTRWEEAASPARDEHGRFPAAASVAYRQGFLGQPLLDRYALVLQAWLQHLRPHWQPRRPAFRVWLSHDIDFVRPFASQGEAARAIARALLRRQQAGQAGQVLGEWVGQRRAPGQTAALRAVRHLAELSARHGLPSAFFWMAAARSRYDSGYDPAAPSVRDAIGYVRQLGHENGFHPGYHAATDGARFQAELARLEAVLGEKASGGRHHFLRFQPPYSWRQWESSRAPL